MKCWQIRNHRWDSILNSQPNSIYHHKRLGSFLPFGLHPPSCYHKYPILKQSYFYLQTPYFSQPCLLPKLSSVWDVLCPLGCKIKCYLSSRLILSTFFTKAQLSIPKSLLYLLIITLSTLYFEYSHHLHNSCLTCYIQLFEGSKAFNICLLNMLKNMSG